MLPQKVKTTVTLFKVMGWLTIVLGVLGSIIMMVGMGAAASAVAMDDAGGAAIVGGMGMGMAIFGIIISVVFGVVYFLIAKNIPLKKDWARILGIIFAILMLFSFPIGTVIGIILLINIFSDEFKNWWESPSGQVPQM